MQLTQFQHKQFARMLQAKPRPPSGERRTIYLCEQCGAISAHDYIPYAMGRGRWGDMCHCNAVDPNWRGTDLITLKRAALVTFEGGKEVSRGPILVDERWEPIMGPYHDYVPTVVGSNQTVELEGD